jgi:hypothetical protein
MPVPQWTNISLCGEVSKYDGTLGWSHVQVQMNAWREPRRVCEPRCAFARWAPQQERQVNDMSKENGQREI